MGKSELDVESDVDDGRYVAECGYAHRFTVRFDHVFHEDTDSITYHSNYRER